MRAPGVVVVALAAIASPASCAANEPLDHLWDSAHCSVAPGGTYAWETTPGASAYLRREAGASALIVQLAVSGYPGDPYPNEPTIRIAVPPATPAGSMLTVNVDASDLRGPSTVAGGTAWALASQRIDPSLPNSGWLFGTGSLAVGALTMTENDTSSSDAMTLDIALDLSRVTAGPLAPDGGVPIGGMSIGQMVHVRCADDGAPK